MLRILLVTLFSFVAVSAAAPPAPPKQTLKFVGPALRPNIYAFEVAVPPYLAFEVIEGPPISTNTGILINCLPDSILDEAGNLVELVMRCPAPNRVLAIRGLTWRK